MPPILISPLVKWTLIALGGATLVHWVVKEVCRLNEEAAQPAVAKIPPHRPLPTLRRDPESGEYRL